MEAIFLVIEIKGRSRDILGFAETFEDAKDWTEELKRVNVIARRRGYYYEIKRITNLWSCGDWHAR